MGGKARSKCPYDASGFAHEEELHRRRREKNLQKQVALLATSPKCVAPVGAEGSEELVQDAIATAAQMLHNVEAAGKKVTPGNVAYFTILHMKSGCRSVNRSRADVMACGTQLDRKASVLSMEEDFALDPEKPRL